MLGSHNRNRDVLLPDHWATRYPTNVEDIASFLVRLIGESPASVCTITTSCGLELRADVGVGVRVRAEPMRMGVDNLQPDFDFEIAKFRISTCFSLRILLR